MKVEAAAEERKKAQQQENKKKLNFLPADAGTSRSVLAAASESGMSFFGSVFCDTFPAPAHLFDICLLTYSSLSLKRIYFLLFSQTEILKLLMNSIRFRGNLESVNTRIITIGNRLGKFG